MDATASRMEKYRALLAPRRASPAHSLVGTLRDAVARVRARMSRAQFEARLRALTLVVETVPARVRDL